MIPKPYNQLDPKTGDHVCGRRIFNLRRDLVQSCDALQVTVAMETNQCYTGFVIGSCYRLIILLEMEVIIMYTMKETCEKTGLSYETLKFYCNQGLVPNVKRDKQNHRVFDDRDVAWINSLNCLKNCNMGIGEMREYLALCLQGEETIPQRKRILEAKQEALKAERKRIEEAIAYIDWKQSFYDDVRSGKIKYFSNLIAAEE